MMSRPDDKADFNGEVQSVRRALSLLEVLAGCRRGMKLKTLAELAELPPSTTHRLLTTLQNHHYVRFEPGGHLWVLGRRVAELASALCSPAPAGRRGNGCGAA